MGLDSLGDMVYGRQQMGVKSDRGLTVAEVARRLSLHPNSIRKMIRRGAIPAAKMGRTWRVRESEVERLLSEGIGGREEA